MLTNIILAIVGLLLIIFSFLAGKKISDDYNSQLISKLEYRIHVYEIEKGIGYVQQQPVRKYVPIGQPFMDKLKENGRATQKFSRSDRKD